MLSGVPNVFGRNAFQCVERSVVHVLSSSANSRTSTKTGTYEPDAAVELQISLEQKQY